MLKHKESDRWKARLYPFEGIVAVPYVAAWSAETEFGVEADPLLGQPALFRRTGFREGRPILGKMDEARQRICMVSWRCQVCTIPLAGSEAFTIYTGQKVEVRGIPKNVPLTREPPSCFRCMRLALEVCPGLQRQRDAGQLVIYRIEQRQLVSAYLGPDGSGDKLDRFFETYSGPQPVGYVKAALTKFTLCKPERFK